MITYCYDIEANGLLDTATKLHCFSYKSLGGDMVTVTDVDAPFKEGDTWVAHNHFGYDLPLLVKLGILKDFTPNTVTYMDGTVVNVQFIDTLALSREWYPDHPEGHGLKAWAKKLGTYKPEVEDWIGLSLEEYTNRCENDVLTTEKVFMFLCDKLEITL